MHSRFRLLALAALAILVSGCALPYYLQAARGQVGLMRQRVPIDELVADATTDAATRERLALVGELRRFAVDRLGLPDNDSYTTFVDLGRDYVVYNVIAAGEFSVAPVTWCFPVAGCVAYRGYFDRERAESYAARLEAQGFDVFSGGSPAYSTLGFFDDPVLSTMIVRDDAAVAAVLFHELAHQRVYIKGDTELSESYATAVEQHGVEAWLRAQGATEALAGYRARIGRQNEFALLVARHRDRLAALYAEPLAADAMRAAKAEAYGAMRADYAALKASWGGIADYDAWFAGELNNATLVAITSYARWVPALRARLEARGPVPFHAEVERIAGLDIDERIATLERWERNSAAAVLPELGHLVGPGGEVAGHDRLHALRRDAESGEPVVAADARDGQ